MNILRKHKLALTRFIARHYPSKKYFCIHCQSYVGRFLPYEISLREFPKFPLSLEIIGSDLENFTCPKCGCHDRERHLFLYLQSSGKLSKFESAKVLHFAPESHLSLLISKMKPSEYIKADISPASDDIQLIDMTKIPFDDEAFDIVIANHVLEHIEAIEMAISELTRVLKKGGFAILQTPYCRKLKNTFSDPGIVDEFARTQAYGQKDHVRLFGSDIFELFDAYGLNSLVKSHHDLLDGFSAEKYGVNGDEPFFLFQKV